MTVLDPHPLKLQHFREESLARTVVRCVCGCRTTVYINDEALVTRKQVNYERDGIKAALEAGHDAYWSNVEFPYRDDGRSVLNDRLNALPRPVLRIEAAP